MAFIEFWTLTSSRTALPLKQEKNGKAWVSISRKIIKQQVILW